MAYVLTGKETDTDLLVMNFLNDIEVNFHYQGTKIKPIDDALKNASKQASGKGKGTPEFLFQSGNQWFVVEDKTQTNKLEYLNEDGIISTDFPYRNDYAVNGAVHYAKHLVEKSPYKEIIAIGVVGDKHFYEIQPYYVDRKGIKKLNTVKSFEDFSPRNIEEYINVAIKGLLPKDERELREITKVAADLHEDLRNYGNLSNDYKATVVSGILLALEESTFSIDDLKGFQKDGTKDGDKIYDAVEVFLQEQDYKGRPNKYGILLENFLYIKNDKTLNTISPRLGMTPLKYFTDKIKDEVYHRVKNYEHDIDILGKFYSEFVKYGGSDGNSLGIVLTPRHITSLMAELIDVQPDDIVMDPACGSGAFLISAMQRMIRHVENNQFMKQTKKSKKIEDIKANQLYGVELQGKLYTIATTNMILRGDGKSNLIYGDMFHLPTEQITIAKRDKDGNVLEEETIDEHGKRKLIEVRENIVTKILLNPPYGQAKTRDLTHLSEISFIKTALSMMRLGGKFAAIVPISTMVGKTKEDVAYKKAVLASNTLESVITLNTDTFYGVGVNPCICIFTAGIPHDWKKRVSFVDFSDDGYEIAKHIGLVANGTEKSKREHLVDVLNGNADDSSEFIVKSTITAEDEWLHSFYYFNEQIPNEKDFEKTIADYLTFEFDMYSHGKSYLFGGEVDD